MQTGALGEERDEEERGRGVFCNLQTGAEGLEVRGFGLGFRVQGWQVPGGRGGGFGGAGGVGGREKRLGGFGKGGLVLSHQDSFIGPDFVSTVHCVDSTDTACPSSV